MNFCPICKRGNINNLESHLLSHTKQSLISILLQQHQQDDQQQVEPFEEIENNIAQIVLHEDNNEIHVENVPIEQLQTFDDEQQPTLPTIVSVEGQGQRQVLNDAVNYSQSQQKQDNVKIKTEPDTLQISTFKFEIKNYSEGEEEDGETEENYPCSSKDLINEQNEILASRLQLQQLEADTELNEEGEIDPLQPQNNELEELNAIANSTIIKFIVDEEDQPPEENNESLIESTEKWILPDGSSIPVYSKIVQNSTKESENDIKSAIPSTSSISFHNKRQENTYKEKDNILIEENSSCSEGSQAKQIAHDLMTDEEIPPPGGEISEYEESNFSYLSDNSNSSSILNQCDKNNRSNLVSVFNNDSRQMSPINSETSVFSKKKKRSSSSQQNSLNMCSFSASSNTYLCYECFRNFTSLFELIQHKIQVHDAKGAAAHAQSVKEQNEKKDNNNELFFDVAKKEIVVDVEEEGEDLNPLSNFVSNNIKEKLKRKYFCIYCEHIDVSVSSISKHMNEEHPDKPKNPSFFECKRCGKSFKKRTNLIKHFIIHGKKSFICPTCSKGFTTNCKLQEHISFHAENYPHNCSYCDKKFRTIGSLNYHKKMNHTEDGQKQAKKKTEFVCRICNKILHSKVSFESHVEIHTRKPKKCIYCSESFSKNSVLIRHIRVQHDSNYDSKDSKKCPLCFKIFHKNSLRNHMRIHNNLKPYSCQVCHKNFRTLGNLSIHSWSHTNNEKPYKCKMCPKSYIFRKSLENHQVVHKRKTMHYVCNECGVKFTYKVNMKRHLAEHYADKKFKCNLCEKSFHRNYYLQDHMKTHTGLKPYNCTICGKTSATKSNHKSHLKIHDANRDQATGEN